MHDNSLRLMRSLLNGTHPKLVFDIGSANINGTYRSIVAELGAEYIGLDICSGDNVDIVIPERPEEGELLKIVGRKSRFIISGQCLEHTRAPWVWIKRVSELLEDGGHLFIIAPFMWPEHKYPVDCWRFAPDGMLSLAEWAGLTLVRSDIDYINASEADCWAIMRKPGDE